MDIKEFLETNDYRKVLDAIGKYNCCDHFYLMDKNQPKQNKEILFVTNDGKEIKRGDVFWFVTKKNFNVFSHFAVSDQLPKGDCVLFGYKKNADAWVFDNKPIYSVRDFRELIKMLEERFISKIEPNV